MVVEKGIIQLKTWRNQGIKWLRNKVDNNQIEMWSYYVQIKLLICIVSGVTMIFWNKQNENEVVKIPWFRFLGIFPDWLVLQVDVSQKIFLEMASGQALCIFLL